MKLRRIKPFLFFLLCIYAPVLLSAQVIRHSYRFYNNLSVSPPECGPDLTQAVSPGNCGAPASPGSYTFENLPACGLVRTVYSNNIYWGLRYDNAAGTITGTYTIHMYVKNTDWGPGIWTRIIDFSNGASDDGIYYRSTINTQDRCMYFYPSGLVGACPYFNLSTYYLLTFTRNGATGVIDVYVNNTLFNSFTDAAGRYKGTAGVPVCIYRDDAQISCESGAANFAYLSFTNIYSNQQTVDSVYNAICTIANAPSADFSFNPTRSCNFPENIEVTYTGSIAPPGTGYSFSWNWDGGNVVSGSGMGPYVINWPTPGVKNVTLTINNTGCGSSISNTHSISLLPKNQTTVNQNICSGQSYQGYSATGTYTDTFHLAGGCDSIRLLNLTVNSPVQTHISQTICSGTAYQGHSATGIYNDTFATAAGCDSVRILNLTVTPPPVTSLSQSICAGSSFLGYTATGNYNDTFSTAAGCDSVRVLHLTVKPVARTTVVQTICVGQTFLGYSATGTYRDTFPSANGCDSIRTLNLTVITDPAPQLGPDRSFCTGDSIILEPGVFNSYLWQDGNTSNVYVVKHTGLYTVALTGNCGVQNDDVFITELPCVISFPSAFSPNGDGLNESFGIMNAPPLQSYQLLVYNRWGQKIFESGKATLRWNGTFNGKLQPNGVYTWYCVYVKNGVTKRMRGTVVLVR